MVDADWLFGGAVPKFEQERDFSRALADRLDGAQVKSRWEARATYTLEAEHDSERDDGDRPDITVHHDISVDNPENVADRLEPSNPFYIECKLGEAFQVGGDELASYRDTGIYKFYDNYEQLLRYKYGNNPVEHSDIFSKGKSTYRDAVPGGDSDVILACPYTLCWEFSHPEDEIDNVCGEQFKHGQFKHGFGILFRPKLTEVLIALSHDDYYYLVE
ncbi:hypothetical protein ACYJ1Y_18260 [Natrialbaceae archaeon A-gly3]